MTNEQITELIGYAEHMLELRKSENNEHIANQFKYQIYGMQDVLKVLGYDLKVNLGSCKAEIVKIDK
jgi:hypothetical protein